MINDLADGRVTLEVNGVSRSYPVDAAVVQAILSNQSVYRMGHIGPDASPDIFTGQMVIHPGTVSFGTDQWAIALNDYINDPTQHYSDEDWYAWKDSLCEAKDYDLDEIWGYLNNLSEDDSSSTSGSYLSSADEAGLLDAIAKAADDNAIRALRAGFSVNPTHVAYEKGFLGHLASDAFAHSYVNYYAGDVFSLMNGEIETEKRHAAVEAYIDSKLPPLPQGAEHKLIQSPSEFLAEAFVFNPKVVSHFGLSASVDGSTRASPGAYLYAIHKLRKGVRNAASSCVWTAIDRFAMQIAINAWTGYLPNEDQIAVVNEVQDAIHGLTSDIKQGVGSAHNKLNSAVTSAHRANFKRINKIMKSFESHVNTLNRLEQDILDAERKINNEIVGKQCGYEKKVCDWVPGIFGAICKDKIEKGPACATHDAYNAALDLKEKAIAERDRQVGSLLNSMEEELANLETAVMEIHELSEVMTNTIVRISDFSSDISPFREALTRWDTDIKEATVAWIDANAQVIEQSMIRAAQPPSSEDRNCFQMFSGIGDCLSPTSPVMKPLSDWMSTYALVFAGIPADVGKLGTQGSEVISSLETLIGGRARNSLLSVSSPVSRMGMLDLEHQLSKELSGIDMVEEALDFTGNEEWLELYNGVRTIFAASLSKNDINSLFAKDPTNLGLITASRITDTMDRDMGLTPGSSAAMNWKNFPVMANAITLAKLALLQPAQLSKVATDLGIPQPSVYGNQLYPEKNCYVRRVGTGTYMWRDEWHCDYDHESHQNVLYYAIKNIDGHQSWKPKADKLPRIGYSFDISFAMNDHDAEYPPLEYGYSRIGNKQGFRFWQVGETYFNRMFDMPMNDEKFGENSELQEWDPDAINPAVLVAIINSILLH